MKVQLKTFTKLAFLILVTSIPRILFACPQGKGQPGLVCPGEYVLSSSGDYGQVLGVNPTTGAVAINFTRNERNSYIDINITYPIETLAIGHGCTYGGFCVGDEVISDSGWTGQIVGVNAYRQTVGVHWSRNERNSYVDRFSIAEISRLALTKLCERYGPRERNIQTISVPN